MTSTNTPPSSLMDSTTSPKVKTMEGEGVGACSLVFSTSGVKGRARTPRWGLRRLTRKLIIHMDLHQPTTSWLVGSWTTLVHGQATCKHELTRFTTARTWGKPPPSPLIAYFFPNHGTNTQMPFCPGIPKWESWNSHNWDSHNFGSP